MEPKMTRRTTGPIFRQCTKCNQTKSADAFLNVRYWTFADGKYHICNDCLKKYFINVEWDWQELDKFCQSIDVPFIPSEFERLHEINEDDVLPIYIRMFAQLEYEALEWKQYHDKYMELKRKSKLDMELPNVRDSYFEDLKLRWGHAYDDEALLYLENLYNGMLSSQNINGALQTDQAQKLCKVSWEIDERIRAGTDFDKLMASYEKMAKIADFTPKNVRNDSDFSSMGEIVAWSEKRGWLNPHYDGAKKDIIDEFISSTETFAQRLYINETGAGEEINERIAQLKIAAELDRQDSALDQKRLSDDELFFQLDEPRNLEGRENEMYQELIMDDLDSDTMGV